MYAVIGIVVVAFLTAGCSGVSVVGYPLDNGKHMVQRTVSDPHAFAPTTQRSWLEVCDRRVETRETPSGQVEEVEHYDNCERDGQVQFTTTNGYLDGLGAAALYSGAIVGGAYFIGKGIGDSGTTVNQSGGGASQAQSQFQEQRQTQSNFQTQSQTMPKGKP